MSNLIDWMENTADQVPGASAVLDRAVYEFKELMAENERLTKCLEIRLASEAVPEGWQIVPKALTDEMAEAPGCEGYFKKSPFDHAQDIWDAMLAVAPLPSEEDWKCTK